jgi:hypothetical protein
LITALWHRNENVAERLNGRKIKLGKQKYKNRTRKTKAQIDRNKN